MKSVDSVFPFLMAVILQTDLNVVSDWQTKSKEFQSSEEDGDQHPKGARAGGSVIPVYWEFLDCNSKVGVLGTLCSWGWHVSRGILNNPRCKNQFTSLKHVLKYREKQLKEAGGGKKIKIKELLIEKLHRSSQGHSWDTAVPKGPAKLQTWGEVKRL